MNQASAVQMLCIPLHTSSPNPTAFNTPTADHTPAAQLPSITATSFILTMATAATNSTTPTTITTTTSSGGSFDALKAPVRLPAMRTRSELIWVAIAPLRQSSSWSVTNEFIVLRLIKQGQDLRRRLAEPASIGHIIHTHSLALSAFYERVDIQECRIHRNGNTPYI
nr:unnamed protein product [Spirometra erinaceieuropaei]